MLLNLSNKETTDLETIDDGIKSISHFGKDDLMLHIIYSGWYYSDANSDGSLTVMLVHEDDFKSNETLLTTPATTGGLFINMDGGQVYMSEAAESLRPKLSATYSDGSTSTIYSNTSGPPVLLIIIFFGIIAY